MPEIVAMEGDVQFTVLELLLSQDPVQFLPQTAGEQDPSWLEADQGHAVQVAMVLDQLMTKPPHGEPEGLVA